MLDQLRQIAVFAKTVERGSFQAAARALKLSPSVVSHHVARLEAHLGAPLLYRSTRRLALTPDGERLIAAAQTMLDAAESGLHAVRDTAAEPSGELRVTLPAVISQSEITDRIARFAAAHPKVALRLDYTNDRRELIRDGFDLSIRIDWLKDSTLMARKLGVMPRRLVAAPTLLAERPPVRDPADLEALPWAELQAAPNRRVPLMRGADRAEPLVRPHLSVNDAKALTRLALAGAGVAILPDFLTDPHLLTGELVELIPDWRVEEIGVYAVWPPNAARNGLTARLVGHLVRAS